MFNQQEGSAYILRTLHNALFPELQHIENKVPPDARHTSMSREAVKWHTGGRAGRVAVVFLSYVHYSTAVISKVWLMISTHWERGRWPWGENKTKRQRDKQRERAEGIQRKSEIIREGQKGREKKEYRMRERERKRKHERKREETDPYWPF